MDNIGRISDLVVTGFRQSRGWESHSHPVGSGCDRVDIQSGRWASFNLGEPWSNIAIEDKPDVRRSGCAQVFRQRN